MQTSAPRRAPNRELSGALPCSAFRDGGCPSVPFDPPPDLAFGGGGGSFDDAEHEEQCDDGGGCGNHRGVERPAFDFVVFCFLLA